MIEAAHFHSWIYKIDERFLKSFPSLKPIGRNYDPKSWPLVLMDILHLLFPSFKYSLNEMQRPFAQTLVVGVVFSIA